ncbi:MAG TPA: hypothetical protein VLV86_19015 [Vicinamibacterales bacterium]|nr:hypothetical protein [Vicinamibacterales bacterium]
MVIRRSRSDRGKAHVDQEKSIVDVFEHVIRGVRLDRLRVLLRAAEQLRRMEDDDPWKNSAEPTTA